jgi:hypothetical protein
MSLLSQLRRKPERMRRQIALIGSVCATVAIALFWLASFGARLTEETAENERGVARSGPFQELGAAVSLFTKESAAALRELKSLLPQKKEVERE